MYYTVFYNPLINNGDRGPGNEKLTNKQSGWPFRSEDRTTTNRTSQDKSKNTLH